MAWIGGQDMVCRAVSGLLAGDRSFDSQPADWSLGVRLALRITTDVQSASGSHDRHLRRRRVRKIRLIRRLAVVGGILIGMLMPLGCGADATPDTVVQNYLNAVADNKAEAACDLVTARVRAKPDFYRGKNCQSSVRRLFRFLDGSEDSVHPFKVLTASVAGNTAKVLVVTDNVNPRLVTVDLVKFGGRWRIDTTLVAMRVLGLA